MSTPKTDRGFRAEGHGNGTALREIKKQVSFNVPLSEWKQLQLEAAQQGISVAELCQRALRARPQKAG